MIVFEKKSFTLYLCAVKIFQKYKKWYLLFRCNTHKFTVNKESTAFIIHLQGHTKQSGQNIVC